ncbi:MAG: LysM peptidoglycan-binding domain-containing protein [Desulfobacteraceae bacterium]|nr:MAG: LysM peptidoglycan-binding domain-containing protein [Desulfobacteraceae bacterium]
MHTPYKSTLLFLLLFLVAVNAAAAPLDQLNLNSPAFLLMPPGPVTFCGERVPLEIQDVKERFEREMLISAGDRVQAFLWLKRSRRYLPYIEQALKENGMPDDLKYIIIAESALKPNAVSHKGAVGYWQFIPETGKNYGLTVNGNKDERRNFFTSTQAALNYLKNLHGMLGSWTLAAAAYNMGEEGLLAEMHEQETVDFYNLYLYNETQRYLFRIIAIKLIMQDPARYGFKLTDKDYYPPIAFDRIAIGCTKDIPIKLIAKAAKTSFKEIKDLNPEIRGYFLPKGDHTILIPKGASEGFADRYENLVNNFFYDQGKHVYVVKKGDTLYSIAKMFDIPMLSISIWNKLDKKLRVRPGDRLVIYPKKAEPEANGM